MPKTYRERSSDTILAKEGDPDYQKLMKTRPGFFKDEKHSQESIMRGLEEADDAEKNLLSRGVSKVKKAILGSDVDNELAKERMRKMDEKNPDSSQAKVNKALGMKKGGKVKKYENGGLADAASDAIKKGAMAGLEDAASGPRKKGATAGLEDVMSSLGRKGAMAGGLGMKSGGKVSSASKRADGCAIRGKTRA